MKSIRLLKKRLIEEEVSFTNSFSNAIYLLPDGSLIDGLFENSMRNEDHRTIFSGVDYGDYYASINPGKTHWDRIHKEYKVVRLIPETKYALIGKHQRLTEIQKEQLAHSHYLIERY